MLSAAKRRLSLVDNDSIENNTRKRAKPIIDISDDTDVNQFNDGNIINIKLKNFVTYGQTEFKLSPTLNMIIGPNGTGKSTLVCAICLGLAGKPELLGRQKYSVDFIKEGTDHCVIEITIKDSSNSSEVVIVTREMNRSLTSHQKEKSEWFIDKQKKDEKSVKGLIKRLNIQLDNLCCFLPQDKVSAFSGLKPTELLMETERAVGNGELLEQHLKLIEYDFSKRDLTKTLEGHKDTISGLEISREQFKSEVEKYQKYMQKKMELINHEKLLPFAIVSDNKKKAAAYKARKKYLQQKFNDFKERIAPLDDNANVYRQQIQKFNNDVTKLQTNSQKLIMEFKNNETEIRSMENEIVELQTERTKAENRSATKLKHLEETIKEISKQQDELQQFQLPTSEERAEVSDKMLQIKEQLQTTLADISEIDQKMGDIRNEASSQVKSLNRLESMVKSSDKFQIFNLFKPTKALENCKKAVQILRQHPEFKGRIFEPPILSIGVTNEKFIKFFDVLIDRNTRFAFTAKTKADYDEAVSTIFSGINVSMRTLGNKGSYQKHSSSDFANSDFDGYLINFANGPSEVLQMIYEQCLQNIPVSSKQIPSRFLDVLKQKTNSGKPQFSRVCADNQIHYFSVSNFGSKQVISRTNFVRQNKNSPFNAKVVSDDDLNELRELRQSIQDKQKKYKELENENAQLSNVRNRLQAEYQDLKNQKSLFQQKNIKHETKLRNIETLKERKKKLEKDAKQDMSEKINILDFKISKLFQNKTDLLASTTIPLEKIVKINNQLLSLEMKKLDSENKLTAMKSLSSKFSLIREEFQEMIEKATESYNRVRKVDEVRRLKAQIDNYSDEDKSILADLMEHYSKENSFSEVEIRAKIQIIKSELDAVEDASAASIDKLRNIEEQLENLYAIVPDLTEKLQRVNSAICSIEGPWSKELNNLVDRISKNFSSSFISVASAGEVRLNTEGEGYKDWRLELLVKFRDESDLRVLDPYVQSGGERAVSTIFYMLSLQGLTNSPFRVVDEINQGMDPKNERIVHKYMVESACKPNNQNMFSQYFLITPKLLTNLFYHEKMAVHCIMANHIISSDVLTVNNI